LVNQSSLNELALFAGAGGGILGGKLLGWRTICAVEWEAYPASVLCARQNDGLLPPFPIWDDIQTFDGRPWRGIVQVVSGGFPCQDISAAGKGAGIDGERSGMWREMARVVSEVRPRYVFVENSPMLVTRGLERVIGDLTALGYDTKWTVMGAADVGANHQRDRIWIVGKMGNANHNGQIATQISTSIVERSNTSQTWAQKTSEFARPSEQYAELANTNSAHGEGNQCAERTQQEHANADSASQLADTSSRRYEPQEKQIRTGWDGFKHKSWWEAEPNVGRVADGVASRVDRLKAIGNGQVPLCAATAWRILSE